MTTADITPVDVSRLWDDVEAMDADAEKRLAALHHMRSHLQSIAHGLPTRPVGSVNASKCAPGTYNDAAEQDSCTPCTEGSYQNATGAIGCKRCTSGHYCTEGTAAPLPPSRSVEKSCRSCIACLRARTGGTAAPRAQWF